MGTEEERLVEVLRKLIKGHEKGDLAETIKEEARIVASKIQKKKRRQN